MTIDEQAWATLRHLANAPDEGKDISEEAMTWAYGEIKRLAEVLQKIAANGDPFDGPAVMADKVLQGKPYANPIR